MIIDSHSHAWRRWPYDPPVPDADTRGSAEQLLFEMDQAGVDRAVIIAAGIRDNADNNVYAMESAVRRPDRLIVFADIDSRWTPTYRTAGAAERLAAAAERWNLVGFTHYLAEDDDGAWLVSEEGRRFFTLAEERNLIASLSIVPSQMPAVTAVASRHPRLRILLHHLAFLGPRTAATVDGARLVFEAARHPNIHIKISGFGNVAAPGQEYPYRELSWIVPMLHAAYGPWRLVWGSDYPVSRRHMTYRQTLDMLRRHSSLPEASVDIIAGQAMAALLDRA